MRCDLYTPSVELVVSWTVWLFVLPFVNYIMLTWEKIPSSPRFSILQATKCWVEPGIKARWKLLWGLHWIFIYSCYNEKWLVCIPQEVDGTSRNGNQSWESVKWGLVLSTSVKAAWSIWKHCVDGKAMKVPLSSVGMQSHPHYEGIQVSIAESSLK